MNSKKTVIRKYANRRLYDTSTSRYINLEDIAALVRNGKDVQIVDAATGEDLTRVTLTQVIVEDARDQPAGLPLELLRQLIVASDHVGQEFIMWYLKSAFDAYRKVQSSLQDRISQVHSAAMSPLEIVKNFVQSAPPERDDVSDEVRELRRRLSELEARPQKPLKRNRAKKRTGTKRPLDAKGQRTKR
jgi:polyhydroxyalkanoate synthesis repressor PhaR